MKIQFQDLMLHVPDRNKKVPYQILNFSSAMKCPAQAMCKNCKICYAKREEIRWPSVRKSRATIRNFWNTLFAVKGIKKAAEYIADHLTSVVVRFSECGDMQDDNDVQFLVELAKILKKRGQKLYGYTARVDLQLQKLIKAGVYLNLSNDADVPGSNRFLVVEEPTGNNPVCAGDCSKCKLCYSTRNITVEVVKH